MCSHLVRNKQVKLNNFLVLNKIFSLNTNDSKRLRPRLWQLLGDHDISVALCILSTLDQAFSCSRIFLSFRFRSKGTTDSKFNILQAQQRNNFVAKEGTVHPDLNRYLGQKLSCFSYISENKAVSAILIMNITGSIKKIKYLPSLNDCTKQGIVTTLALVFLIVSNRTPFCVAFTGYNRTVKI
jgi:hypothetical protein